MGMTTDIGARDITTVGIAVMIFSFGIWLGAMITTNRTDQFRQTAVNNAVAAAMMNVPETTLRCDDNEVIDAIKRLADNGAHIGRYDIIIEFSNEGGKSPYRERGQAAADEVE